MKEMGPKPAPKQMARLDSVDALRGFDMFWIMGAGDFFTSLAGIKKSPFLTSLAIQFEHPYWNGFTFWDTIFPLFMFLSGISAVFSIDAKMQKGIRRQQVLNGILRRGLILFLLGMFVNNGLNIRPISDIRFPSVLGKIGVCYAFAGLIYLYTDNKSRLIWFWSLLVGYWALLCFTSAPGFPRGDLTEPGNFISYLDRTLLPGKLSRGIHDTSGFFCNITGIATTLAGMLAGDFLKNKKNTPSRKAGLFAATGVFAIALALLWSLVFPINKNLWSSSFVLLTTGWNLLLLAAFYFLIDVKGYKRWTFFFQVIGMNSIFIYISPKLVHYGYFANGLFGWFEDLFGVYKPPASLFFVVLTEWLVLYFLYRKKIFARI